MTALLDFVKPPLDRAEIRSLAQEIEIDFVYVSTYLNWFSAEVLVELGAEDGLAWLFEHGSKRVSLGEIENDFESQKFRRMIYRNATQGNVEIQSLTGLQEGIRRYLIGHLLREGKNHQEIASTVGTSLRTVQRHSAVQSKT
jgi:uncharacterized protein YerC